MIKELGKLSRIPIPHHGDTAVSLTDHDIKEVAAEARSLIKTAGLSVDKSHHWLNPQKRPTGQYHTDGFDIAMAILSEDEKAGTMYRDDESVYRQCRTWTLYHMTKDVMHRSVESEKTRILLCYRVNQL